MKYLGIFISNVFILAHIFLFTFIATLFTCDFAYFWQVCTGDIRENGFSILWKDSIAAGIYRALKERQENDYD